MSSVPTIPEFIFSKNLTNSSLKAEGATGGINTVLDFVDSTTKKIFNEDATFMAGNIDDETSTVFSIGNESTSTGIDISIDNISKNASRFLYHLSEKVTSEPFDYTTEPIEDILDGNLTTNSTTAAQGGYVISFGDLLIFFGIFIIIMVILGQLYKKISNRMCAKRSEEALNTSQVVAQYRARYPKIDEEDEEDEDTDTNIQLFRSPISESPTKSRPRVPPLNKRNKDYVPMSWTFENKTNTEIEMTEFRTKKNMETQTYSDDSGSESVHDGLTPEQLAELKKECKAIAFMDV